MKTQQIDFLIQFILFLPILTFHETAHAWVALKCGDDTAKHLGRISLNPLVHIDLIGTIILPLVALFTGAGLIGWGKPVPIDPGNFRRYRVDDNLVAMAGPAANILLATVALVAVRLAQVFGSDTTASIFLQMAFLSVFLAFFNLIPIPPLDGSHLLKNAIRLDEGSYARFTTIGFIVLILVIQVPVVMQTLQALTYVTVDRLFWFVRVISGGSAG
jgi:Zn-dependent protease